jgi:hypothetical protein
MMEKARRYNPEDSHLCILGLPLTTLISLLTRGLISVNVHDSFKKQLDQFRLNLVLGSALRILIVVCIISL